MNPLQEYPFLFANNEFKVDTVGGVQNIECLHIDYEEDGYVQESDYYMLQLSDGDIRPPKQCTLIARPISDMTDEEKQEAYERCDYFSGEHEKWSDYKEYIIGVYKNDYYLDDDGWDEIEELEGIAQNTPVLLYYLSIGVYPFDQSHFDDGTVIDGREV